MLTVKSKDGTLIAFEKSGEGLPLIIVGGALADHQHYAPLAEQLSINFTVYNFDRRGRGQSGDTKPYAVDREVEDLAALVAEGGEPAFLYGHSAGSALALRGAAEGLDIAGLALADAPYSPPNENDESAKAEFAMEAARVQELYDKGDHRGSALFFLSGFDLAAEDVEALLDGPGGDSMIDCARALPYDYAMLDDGLVPTTLADRVRVPTLVLAATDMQSTARAIAEAIPNGRFEPIDAPTHALPPEVTARVLGRFFRDHIRRA